MDQRSDCAVRPSADSAGRCITHEETAEATLVLSSDLSSGVMPTVIPVNGGYDSMGN